MEWSGVEWCGVERTISGLEAVIVVLRGRGTMGVGLWKEVIARLDGFSSSKSSLLLWPLPLLATPLCSFILKDDHSSSISCLVLAANRLDCLFFVVEGVLLGAAPVMADGIPGVMVETPFPSEDVRQYTDGVEPWTNWVEPWTNGVEPWTNGVEPWTNWMEPWTNGVEPWTNGVEPWTNGMEPWINGMEPWTKEVGFWTNGTKGEGLCPSCNS